MRLQQLLLALVSLVALDGWAGAGLTGAGVDNSQQPANTDEPTLAQVAPTPGANAATAGVSIAGNPVPGTTATAAGASAANPAGAAAVTAPTTPAKPTVVAPPPPDPATLPV